MTLHIFNPEHDIALASNLACFTAPHAGRQLRHDLAFLPALWASPSDVLMADDASAAQQSLERFAQSMRRSLGISISCVRQWVQYGRPSILWQSVTEVEPWGWDSALRARLLHCGVNITTMPSDEAIATMRQLSHRRTAAALLPLLRTEGTVGEAFECQSEEEISELLSRHGHLVLKAPWSSSGRGIRFVNRELFSPTSHDEKPNDYGLKGWLRNIIAKQGSVMAEPYYNKVKDFGMEFHSDGCGQIEYLGLSLFHTANGAYTGNIIATEAAKREMIGRYLPLSLLDNVQEKICQELGPVFNSKYSGPFGIDMMIVHHPDNEPSTKDDELSLHPCVEINLRRTMGHVALALTPTDDDIRRVMRIEYAKDCYKLKLSRMK